MESSNEEKLIKQLNSYYSKHGADEKFLKYVGQLREKGGKGLEILRSLTYVKLYVDLPVNVFLQQHSKEANLICEYAIFNNEKLTRDQIALLEDAIIKIKSAKYIYKFARYVKNVNIEKLETAITKKKNAIYIYFFALKVPNANIQRLEEGIIKTKNAKQIFLFAKNVKGANIENICEALQKIGAKKYIEQFNAFFGKTAPSIAQQYSKETQ